MKNSTAALCLIGLLTFGVVQIAAASVVYAEEGASKSKEEPKKEDAKKDDGKNAPPPGVAGGRFAGDPIYVHVPPMVLPAINDKGVEQLITIIMDIQVKDFDAADDLHSNMPRVMDALMRGLYGGLGQGSLRNGKLVDVAKVKSKAIAAVGEVISPDKIADVLIQSVSQRML